MTHYIGLAAHSKTCTAVVTAYFTPNRTLISLQSGRLFQPIRKCNWAKTAYQRQAAKPTNIIDLNPIAFGRSVMVMPRTDMRKIREIIRQRLGCKRSYVEIARSVQTGCSTVAECVFRMQ